MGCRTQQWPTACWREKNHDPECLCSPNLVLKVWRVPRELLVFSPRWKLEEAGSQVGSGNSRFNSHQEEVKADWQQPRLCPQSLGIWIARRCYSCSWRVFHHTVLNHSRNIFPDRTRSVSFISSQTQSSWWPQLTMTVLIKSIQCHSANDSISFPSEMILLVAWKTWSNRQGTWWLCITLSNLKNSQCYHPLPC